MRAVGFGPTSQGINMPDDPETIFDPIIDALYPLPDDRETMTLGWLRRVVQDIVRLNEAAGFKGHELQGPYPVKIGYEISERTFRLSHASWFEPLQTYLNVELGMDTTVEAIDELISSLSKRLRKPRHQISLMPVSEAVALLARASTPEADPPASGTVTPEAPADLSPPARAVAAAYDLKKEGKRVNLKAACVRGNVDRGHLREKYPEAVETIRQIATPDRTPKRGIRDPRSGDIDAIDDTDE
jgi:hypothetical protein